MMDRWDKWDYLEVAYRLLIIILLAVPTAFFVVMISEIVTGTLSKFIAYLIITFFAFAWIMLVVGVVAWVVFVAKGTFRPREELPDDGEDLEDIT